MKPIEPLFSSEPKIASKVETPIQESERIEPVNVTVIGNTKGAPLESETIAVTPDHQPNIVITVITPLMAIVVRFLNAYFTMLVGLIAAGMTSNIIPASDFMSLVWTCAKLSIAGAGLGALKDCVTVFGRLEQKYPLATGQV